MKQEANNSVLGQSEILRLFWNVNIYKIYNPHSEDFWGFFFWKFKCIVSIHLLGFTSQTKNIRQMCHSVCTGHILCFIFNCTYKCVAMFFLEHNYFHLESQRSMSFSKALCKLVCEKEDIIFTVHISLLCKMSLLILFTKMIKLNQEICYFMMKMVVFFRES